MRRLALSVPFLMTLHALVSLSPTPAHAQTSAQEEIRRLTGQQVSQEEILSQLAASGLSRDEVRAQLTSMGMDPSIADAYFDRLDGSAGSPLDQSADFLQALAVLGAFNDPSGLLPSDTMSAQRDSLARTLEAIPDSVLTVFGRSIFGGVTTEFRPDVTGPVDPDYQLGPGDQLQLILTATSSLRYRWTSPERASS